ncbi:MAG: hypothetical protein OXU69_13190 [Gemmatimonadota bacterium]|nr:hypothetical protein [Gemmatimonadota bacterium]MDE2985655.1 hypothetical protein [Gemmatimonadota bacterium]
MTRRTPTTARATQRLAAPVHRRSRCSRGPVLVHGLLLAAAGGCSEALPTVQRGDLVRSGFATEVILEYGEFASGARVYGGYGRPSDLGAGFVAHDFGSRGGGGDGAQVGLEASSLLRFGRYPRSAQVLDTTGANVPDTVLTFLDGQLVMRFDTLSSVHNDRPVEIVAHALTEPWDGTTATWEYAIDSVGHRERWSVPGGGAVEEIGSATWDPETGDSIRIRVDSAWIAAWADTTDYSRGIRVSTSTPDVRLRVIAGVLRIDTRPSVNPDTIVKVPSSTENRTFIYAPVPRPPLKTLRVGGVPAWRTVMDLDVPSVLNGPDELCDVVGCPIEITADHVSYAALRFTTRPGVRSFAPSDTLPLDLRSVLAPDFLPKSPLGPSRSGPFGTLVPGEWFHPPAGEIVELAVTGLVRDLLRGETVDGDPVSNTIAVLSALEPLSVEYVSFDGPTSPAAPTLRIVLNFSLEDGT